MCCPFGVASGKAVVTLFISQDLVGCCIANPQANMYMYMYIYIDMHWFAAQW